VRNFFSFLIDEHRMSLLAQQLLKRTKAIAVSSNKQRTDIDSHDSLLHAQNALATLAVLDPRFSSFSASLLSVQLIDSEIELLVSSATHEC
jgi:hypothetical protein